MYGERSRLAETFSADVTRERLPFRMDVAMVAEVVLSPETLVTDLSGIRPFVGMCSLVYEQVVRFSEVASTKTTNKLLTRPEILRIPS